MTQTRAVYVAIAIAVLALVVAAIALAYRPAPQTQTPPQNTTTTQPQGTTTAPPQVTISYRLNIPQNLSLTGNIVLSPYYPVLTGREPLLWFNATGGEAVVKVVVYVNDRSIIAGIYRTPVENQPVYIDLTPYIQGTGTLKINVYFVAYT